MANEEDQDEKTSLLLQHADEDGRNAGDCCCLGVLKEEFRCTNFGFEYPTEDVFYKSQWRWPRLAFVLFRAVLAVYTVTICLLTICYFPSVSHRPWPIWLTNWSYMMLTSHQLCAFVITLLHMRDSSAGLCERDRLESVERSRARHRKNFPIIPIYMKLDWLLFVVASVAGIMVTSQNLIQLIQDPVGTIKGLHAKDINNHYINSVVILLEFCACAIPFRLLHVIYTAIFLLVYFGFTVILWAIDHDNITYDYLDWNFPGDALKGAAVQALLYVPIVHLVLFLVYKLRQTIARKCCVGRHQDADRERYLDY